MFFIPNLNFLKDQQMKEYKISKRISALRTGLLITGLILIYILIIGPSPVLSYIAEEFSLLDNNAALVLTVSVVYPVSALVAMLGGAILPRLGLRRMYRLVLELLILSGAVLLIRNSYAGLMACRVLFAMAYGLSIPFIGSAIMDWYEPKQREVMDTLNGLFPWIGALLCYLLSSPLMDLFRGSWQWSIAVWSIFALPALLLWIFLPKEQKSPVRHESEAVSADDSGFGVYIHLIKRREILACVLTYVFDFSFYAYFSAVYPLFLAEGAGLSEQAANTLASLSFPLVGIIFAVAGGIIASRTGRRKPVVLWGQMFKFVGIIFAMLTIDFSLPLCLVGVGLFTVGNSMYLPGLYMVPMDISDMRSEHVGASFSMIVSAGCLIGGTLAPLLGGKLTDFFVAQSALDMVQAHFSGLRWSILIINTVNIIAFFVVLFLLPETGKKQPKHLR